MWQKGNSLSTLGVVFPSSVYHHGREVISIDRLDRFFAVSTGKIERLRGEAADKDDSLVSG